MKTLNLKGLSDSERLAKINDAFAVHCAGWHNDNCVLRNGEYLDVWCDEKGSAYIDSDDWPAQPPFATSADAVLPLLPKERGGNFWTCDGGFMGARICIRDDSSIIAEGRAATFPLAACLALLKGAGVEVVE